MVLSPLSDIPSIGRSNVYIATLFLFILFSIPAAIAPNYSTLMVSEPECCQAGNSSGRNDISLIISSFSIR